MLALDSAQLLSQMISTSDGWSALQAALASASRELGFQFFALARHATSRSPQDLPVRMHNYPAEWEETYDRKALGLRDPIARASHRVASGFRWSDTPSLVPISDRDEEMFAEARDHGLSDGYTVPANIPGEASGSVTFAIQHGRPFPDAMLLYAQALGSLAYQQARILMGLAVLPEVRPITARQIEVALWLGRDKTDWEIAQILDVAPSTVTKHVRDLCERFSVHRRTSVALRAVWAGYLCFSDIFG